MRALPLLAGIGLLVLAGCGDDERSPPPGPAPSAAEASTATPSADTGGSFTAQAPPPPTELRVTASARGDGTDRETYVVRCTGAEMHPATSHRSRALARRVCPSIAADPTLLTEPVPPTLACSMNLGGRARARIRGTLDGVGHVDRRYSLEGGCEIERWERLFDDVLPRG